MTSSATTLPLDLTDTNTNIDEIDTDIAASITDSAAKINSNDNISTADLVARDDKESKVTTTTSTDTAKSLNESNNKIIKELDDETAKTFPQILMEVLTNDEDSDTISWLPHGRSFIIYKKKKFASKVLVKYFKATKFTSFTRKLNRWGFTRVTRGPEMGSYFHKMFLRDNPELCLRMSSLTSSKYHHTHHDPTNLIHSNSTHMQGHLMMAPGVQGFISGGSMGIPMVPFPFYGMPAMPTGASPMGMISPPGTITPATLVQTKMPAVPATAAELSQQNQYINQQLQQLQWQQFQLQQFQQQQLQASQQAAASSAGVADASNGSCLLHQQPTSGVQLSQIGASYPSRRLQATPGPAGNGVPPPSTISGQQGTLEHLPATNQGESSQHNGTAPLHRENQHQQLQQLPPLVNHSQNSGSHPTQQHVNCHHQQSRPGASQQSPNHHPYSHKLQYQNGQQQSHPRHNPTHSHQSGSNGTNPLPIISHGGHHQPRHSQSYPYQYSQQQPYHHHPQHIQHQQYHHHHHHQQQQQQQQHYNSHNNPHHINGPSQQQQPEVAPLPPPQAEQQLSPAPNAADEIVVPLEGGDQSNGTTVTVPTEVDTKDEGLEI